MPGYFLQKISIEGFRGINNAGDPLVLKFDPKKVNSVFGVNGLGKSSVFEALAYAIRGKVNRLDDMHRDERPSSYYNNCFHPTRIATIILTLQPDDGTPAVELKVERTSVGGRTVTSPTGHSNPDALLDSLDNPFLLLDQTTFLKFVADTPLNRGRAFSSLLGLSEISERRQILRVLSNAGNLRNDLQLPQIEMAVKTLQVKVRDLSTRIEAAYSGFFKDEAEQGVEYTKSPESVVASLAQVPILRDHCLDKAIGELVFSELEKCIATAEQSEQRLRLSQLLSVMSKLESLAPNEIEATELTLLEELVGTLNANLALTEGQDFYGMLTSVKKVITSPEWDTPNACPACDSNLDHPLLPEIEDGLNAYELVEELKASLAKHWNTSSWPGRLRMLEEVLAIPQNERTYECFRSQLTGGSATLEQALQVSARLTELDASRVERLAALEVERQVVAAGLPPSLVSLTSKVNFAATLAKLMPQLSTHSEELSRFQFKYDKRIKWERFITLATTIFSDAEAALSTEVAESLEAKYQDSYGRITNNPAIVPVLERSKGSEDLSLRLKKFHTLTNVPAASLLPESYRNALGISIYLSAAVQFPTVARFMVLDDITSSFDAGHQFALMELIRTAIAHPANPAGPQVVLLSHDGLLEKYFDKIAGQGLWCHHKLQGIPPTGTLLSYGQTPDRLRQIAEEHLKNGRISAAEPIVRQYLEFVLLQIIRRVGIFVPIEFAIQDDRKMVGNAIECIKHGVNMHKAANQLILTATQEIEFSTVHTTAIIGNWVSHYETGSMGVLNAPTLRGVLAAIDNLKACFQYDCSCNGGPQPRFYKSLSAKHCRC
jgi:hypothetical protein